MAMKGVAVMLWLVARHTLGVLPPELEISTEEHGQLFEAGQEMPHWLRPGRTRLTDKEYNKLSEELKVLTKFNRPQDHDQIEGLKKLLFTEDHHRKEEATMKEIAEKGLPDNIESPQPVTPSKEGLWSQDKDGKWVNKLTKDESVWETRKKRFKREEVSKTDAEGDEMGADGRDDHHIESGWWNFMRDEMDKVKDCNDDWDIIGDHWSSTTKRNVAEDNQTGDKDFSGEANKAMINGEANKTMINGESGDVVDFKSEWMNRNETAGEAMERAKAFNKWKKEHEHVLPYSASDNISVVA